MTLLYWTIKKNSYTISLHLKSVLIRRMAWEENYCTWSYWRLSIFSWSWSFLFCIIVSLIQTFMLSILLFLSIENTTFIQIKYISYIVAVSCYGGGKPEYPEKTRPATSHWQTLSHNVVEYTSHEWDSNSDTDCIGSCKSNYHMIMTMTTLKLLGNQRHAKAYNL